MAFRATNQLPQTAYTDAKNLAAQLKNYCDQTASAMLSDIDGRQVIAIASNMAVYKNRFTTITAVPGIAQYARDQEDDQTYNTATEFTAMIGFLDAAIATVQATNVNALLSGWGADGVIYNTFTPAQTATLRGNLQSISAAII